MTRSDYVLIHGAFHGGWCWDAVSSLLIAQGHRVHAPSLAGCGERGGEPHAGITLETHVAQVARMIEAQNLTDIVLVGHSLGGMVVTAVADRCRDRIARLFYLDAFVPLSGEAARDFIPSAMELAALEAVHMHGGRVTLPMIFPAAKFVRFEGEAQSAFMQRWTPHPFLVFAEPVFLANPPVKRRTYVYCSGVPFGLFDGFARAAKDDATWDYHELSTAHDAMIEAPSAVADILLG